ncbi:hypothetical protein HY990_03380 [Candidatus Micrarchaeota archaeon]|nr:hypothetical protein [Candidatus Micrarchaeota archaeon]
MSLVHTIHSRNSKPPLPASAKAAWQLLPLEGADSVFPYSAHPVLMEKVKGLISASVGHVGIVGGFRGALRSHLFRVGLTASVLDIREMGEFEVFCPFFQGDMEESLPGGLFDRNNGRTMLIYPFSIEYTDIGRSTAQAANQLLPGEEILLICHSNHSPIVVDLARCGEMIELIIDILKNLSAEDAGNLLEAAERLDKGIVRIYDNPNKRPNYDPRVVCSNGTNEIVPDGSRRSNAHLAVMFLQRSAAGELSRPFAINYLEDLLRQFVLTSEAAAPVLERRPKILEYRDLVSFVDKRFVLTSGFDYGKMSEGVEKPFAVCARFERAT